MPTESRTRSAGTSRSRPSRVALARGAGSRSTDQDRASVNSRMRSQIRTAAASPACRNDTIPPNSRICLAATSCPGWSGGPGIAHLRPRRMSTSSRPPGGVLQSAGLPIRTPSVLIPRRVSQASSGPADRAGRVLGGTRATAGPASEAVSAPPTTSACPPMYLVVRVHHHVRAQRERLLQVGVRTCCRPPAATRPRGRSAAGSVRSGSPGPPGRSGVSTRDRLGPGGLAIAARTAAVVRVDHRRVASAPVGCSTFVDQPVGCRRRRRSGSASWSPAGGTCAQQGSPRRPCPRATRALPRHLPRSTRSTSCRAVRVGLPAGVFVTRPQSAAPSCL